MPGEDSFQSFQDLKNKLYPESGSAPSEQLNELYLHTCYMLFVDGNLISRAALYFNPGIRYMDKPTALIGNYESFDNPDLSQHLLNHISKEAKNHGAEYIIGPMNGSTWDHYRFSTHNDYPNFLSEPYHHLYYNQHFLSNGFETIATYNSSISINFAVQDERLLSIEAKLRENGMRLRNLDMNHFDKELDKLYSLINDSFESNFLFSPISREYFNRKYLSIQALIDPEYVIIAEDNEKNIIGFIFCYRDLYNTEQKNLIVKTLARSPEKKWSGLGLILSMHLAHRAKQNDFDSLIYAYLKEDANSQYTSNVFGGSSYKKYALYGKEI